MVLFLAGSGQTDRDDNAGRLKIDLFPPLVDAFTQIGFATYRYDKRGVGASQGDFLATGFYDLAADAEKAIEFLSSLEQIDSSKIFVLGHSEGAMLAARLAAGKANVAGAVLLAGSAKSGEETMLWQAKQIVGSLKGFNKALIKFLRIDVLKSQRKTLDRLKVTTQDSTRIQGKRINAKWMREFLTYDPSQDLTAVKVPILAITGAHDIQVDPKDLAVMAKSVAAEIDTHELPGLSHLLRDDPERVGLSAYRRQAKKPLDRKLIELVSDWLSSRV